MEVILYITLYIIFTIHICSQGRTYGSNSRVVNILQHVPNTQALQ